MLAVRMQGVSDIVEERLPHFLCFQVLPAPEAPAAAPTRLSRIIAQMRGQAHGRCAAATLHTAAPYQLRPS